MKCFLSVMVIGIVLSQWLSAGTVPLQKAQESVATTPIHALKSISPPTESVWVKAKIAAQTSDDTFLIQDGSGQITLFLTTDDLISLALTPGMEILIYGKVDISNVGSAKNELDAEQILLPK